MVAIIVSPPPRRQPFIELFLADNFQHSVHFVMSETAKLRARNLVIARLGRREMHMDG